MVRVGSITMVGLAVLWCAAVVVSAAKKPNFVFLLTDDQDVMLGERDIGSLEAMPKLQNLLIKGGSKLTNAMIATPICCPSRTETVTGRFYHNVGAPTGSCMHVDAEANVFNQTGSVFGLLKAAGYATGAIGKVTNDQTGYFCSKERADTMTYVNAPCDYNNYYSQKWFRKFSNGTKRIEHLDLKPETYQTSQLGNRSVEWITQMAQEETPFFLWLGPHAPHYPAVPAPWHADLFPNMTAPRTPSFNRHAPDKHLMVAQNAELNAEALMYIDQHMRDRWSALVSVDDMLSSVIDTLEKLGIADHTYIIYSSDHGYHLGQNRLGCSKEQIYETDIHIPLLVRGPGVKAGSEHAVVTTNVDIAPTVLDLAGVAQPPFMDGHSLAPLLVTEPNDVYQPHSQRERNKLVKNWRTTMLIEYKSVGSYYNDHCSMYFPGPSFEGVNKAGPATPKGDKAPSNCPLGNAELGNGRCYYVDDEKTNSFRALRVLNATHDLTYGEFDPAWTFETLQFVELYDNTADPHQLTNIANSTSPAILADLHQQLATFQQCRGTDSLKSDCP